jgi:hypothetical protein
MGVIRGLPNISGISPRQSIDWSAHLATISDAFAERRDLSKRNTQP